MRDDLPVIPFVSGMLLKGAAHNLDGSSHIQPGIQDISSVEAPYSRNSGLCQVSTKNNHHTSHTKYIVVIYQKLQVHRKAYGNLKDIV